MLLHFGRRFGTNPIASGLVTRSCVSTSRTLDGKWLHRFVLAEKECVSLGDLGCPVFAEK